MTDSANSERERPFEQWLDDLFWLAHPHFTSDDYGRFRDAIRNVVAELTSLRSSLSRKDEEIEGLLADAGGCVCKGNWRLILSEVQHLIGRHYLDHRGETFSFFGLVVGDDDYYYGMWQKGEQLRLLSCVGSIEGHGYTLIGGEDDVCPNCCSPWKYNGPHIGNKPTSYEDDYTGFAENSEAPPKAAQAEGRQEHDNAV